MSLNYILNFSIIITSMFIFSSCGDLFMQKNKSQTSFDRFQKCEMDTNALSDIMVKNIRSELNCLEQNLDLFISIVKTDRPGNLSLKELKLYINKHMPQIDPEVVKSLDVLFEVNSILLGDHKHYIAKENVKRLTNLFKEFNKVMVQNQVVSFFKDKESLTFKEYKFRRSKIFAAISYVTQVLETIPTPDQNTAQMNILNAVGVFKKEFDNEIYQKLSKMLFLKRVFLGGDINKLNATEAKKLVHILSDVITISYDVTHLSKVEDIQDFELEFISIITNISAAFDRSIYNTSNSSDVAFNINQIQQLIEIFVPKAKDFFQYTSILSQTQQFVDAYFPQAKDYFQHTPEVLKLKKILLGSESENFTFSELKEFSTNTVLKNLKKALFFYETFNNNQTLLAQGQMLDIESTNLAHPTQENSSYFKEFNRIVKNYRFIKGKSTSPVYQKFVNRDPLGIFMISLFEDFVLKVIKTYGSEDKKARGGFYLTRKQIENFLSDFKNLLISQELLHPERVLKTSETITLMSGIFQSNSNGDAHIERDEFVQFLFTIMTSIEIKSVLSDRISNYCELDHKGRFSPGCFRTNFYKLLQERDSYNRKIIDYFPKLDEFLKSLTLEKQVSYVKKIESFSRDCMEFQGQEIKMGQGDIFKVFGGLQSVEQTMIRFDDNENNLLQLIEVDKAFNVYRDSIVRMSDPSLSSYAQTFFLYMLKYQKLPQQDFDFYTFVANPYKYSSADRFTIASILKVFSDKSTAPPFPCHTLID